jgi:putative transposase
MPEHVHLLISEPERGSLAVAIQMLKQITARKLRSLEDPHSSQKKPNSELLPHPPQKTRKGGPPSPFWERRYYDFNVWSESKDGEKLDYMHMNPVKRGLVERPEDWVWSSFRHWASGVEGRVEIESPWTARKRERMGVTPKLTRKEK